VEGGSKKEGARHGVAWGVQGLPVDEWWMEWEQSFRLAWLRVRAIHPQRASDPDRDEAGVHKTVDGLGNECGVGRMALRILELACGHRQQAPANVSLARGLL
jgi:hypothetical protein